MPAETPGKPTGNELPQPRPIYLTTEQPAKDPLEGLFVAIRNAGNDFGAYKRFIDRVLCDPNGRSGTHVPSSGAIALDLPLYGTAGYDTLKLATEVFLRLRADFPKFFASKDFTNGNPGVVTRPMPGGSDQYLTSEDLRKGAMASDGVTVKELRDAIAQYINAACQHSSKSHTPYLERIINTITTDFVPASAPADLFCKPPIMYGRDQPLFLELIWSYWHEEGMLAQTMKAISMRFQNRRARPGRDPLAELALDPLRPLNNLLWGYIQDEIFRLTLPRRAYEYDHHYGLRLMGRAVPQLSSADSRTKFIPTFHALLQRTAEFYRISADTTVVADGFPLLNALRDTHIVLTEGMHNQYGDLPWTSRIEMLIEQWLLARPEMREFLRGRHMVAYQEPWMGAVDAMRRLQGWGDTSVMHYHNLAIWGEQLLLSIRHHPWTDNTIHPDLAKLWAVNWKPEVQGYIHAYHAVTGVDLSVPVMDARDAQERLMAPAELIQRRIMQSPSMPQPQLMDRQLAAEAQLLGAPMSPAPLPRP